MAYRGKRKLRGAVLIVALLLLPLYFIVQNPPIPTTAPEKDNETSDSSLTKPELELSAASQQREPSGSAHTGNEIPETAASIPDPRDWSHATVIAEQIERSTPQGSGPALRHRIIRDDGFDFPIRITDAIDFDENGAARKLFEVSAHAANQILLHSTTPLAKAEIDIVADTLGWDYIERGSTQYVAILQSQHARLNTVDNALLAISRSGSPLAAEANHIYYASLQPNDKWFQSTGQWALQEDATYGIDAPGGWDTRTSANSITIAVVDTGIRSDHEDLQANLWNNPLELAGNGIDDDQNGYIDDIFGFNFIDSSTPPEDDSGHGTHAAGIAGAKGNNHIGISGVAWDVNLMAVKVLNSEGKGAASTLASGIDYAIENGADIINASWGSDDFSGAIEAAIARAQTDGIIVVAAAGNDGANAASYPASSELDNVVSVASIDSSGALSRFSNYHRSEVDVVAPGSSIFSTWATGTDSYIRQNGTSAAAPMVSGILALYKSEYPTNTYTEHIQRLILSCKPIEGFEDYCVSGGVVNLKTGLDLDTVTFPPRLNSRSPKEIQLYEGEVTTLSASAIAEPDLSYRWYHKDNLLQESSSTLSIDEIEPNQRGLYTLEISNTEATTQVHFEISVYPRMKDIEAEIGSSILVYASHEQHWTLSTEGDTDSISSNAIPANTEAFLEFKTPTSGMLRFIAQKPLSQGAYSNTLISSPSGTTVIHGPDWSTTNSFGYPDSAFTSRITHSAAYNDTALPEGSLLLRVPEFFETGKLPPLINDQFDPRTVPLGASLNLTIYTGQDGLTYQWYKDDVPLENETNRILEIDSVTLEDAGNYYLVATNEYGTAQSGVATVEVDTSPQPPSATIEGSSYVELVAGEPLSLAMTIAGARPIDYQWYKDGKLIPGATQATLNIDATSIVHSGEYTLSLENEIGRPSGWQPRFTVNVHEQIFTPRFHHRFEPPLDYYFVEGSRISFAVPEPIASAPIAYTWLKDDVPLGEEHSSYSFSKQIAELSDAGTYYLEADNSLGKDQSQRINVHITPELSQAIDLSSEEITSTTPKNSDGPYTIYQTLETWDGEDAIEMYSNYRHIWLNFEPQPTDRALKFRWKLAKGSNAEFTLYLDHTAYQLQEPLEGSDDWQEQTFFIPKDVELRFRLDPNSAPATAWLDGFEEVLAPHLVKDISFTAPRLNQAVTLEASFHAEGGSYQWYKDGIALSGETSSSMTINAFSQANAGNYHLLAKNSHGETESSTVSVGLDSSDPYIPSSFDLTFTGNPRLSIEPNQAPLEEAHYRIEVGEKDSWDEHEWSFSTQVAGPAIFEMDYHFASINAFLELDGVKKWIPSGLRHKTSLYIPSGTHTLKVSVDPYYFENFGNIYSITLSNDPLATLELGYELHHGEQNIPLAKFMGEEPFTLTWFKNGEQISQKTNLSTGQSHVYDRSSTPADQGDYYFEVTDAGGRTSRSNTVSHELLWLVPEVLDAKGRAISLYDSQHNKHHFDFNTKTAGESSLLLTGPFGSNDGYSIRLSSDSIYARFKVRSEGFPQESSISYTHNGEEASIPANQDWIEITADNNQHGLSLTLPESTEQSKVWIDELVPIERRVFVEHPQNTETYLGAKIILRARAFETNNPFMGLTWYRNGIEIPGNGAYPITIDKVTHDDLGEYYAEAQSSSGEILRSKTATLSLIGAEFAEAIGYPGARITTQGAAPWRVDNSNSIEGPTSIVSGDLAPGENAKITIDIDNLATWGIYSYLESDSREFPEPEENRWEFKSTRGWRIEFTISEFEENGKPLNRSLRLDRLRSTRLGGQSYSQWINENRNTLLPFDSSLAKPLADLDSDKIPNWLEFALNLDPATSDTMPSWNVSKLSPPDFESSIRFSATRSDNYSISYEGSFDFETWFTIHPELQINSTNPGYDIIEATLSLDPEAPEPYFVRWRIHYLSEEGQDTFSTQE